MNKITFKPQIFPSPELAREVNALLDRATEDRQLIARLREVLHGRPDSDLVTQVADLQAKNVALQAIAVAAEELSYCVADAKLHPLRHHDPKLPWLPEVYFDLYWEFDAARAAGYLAEEQRP